MANLILIRNYRRINAILSSSSSLINYNLNSLPSFPVTVPQYESKRNLFSNEVLGVDRFVQIRQQINQRFGAQKPVFFQRLIEHISDDKNVILSEDLKNLLFLCDDNDEHIQLLKRTIDKFEKQNESLRFGLFQFGPIVMRLAKHLNNVDMAMWIFNPKYKEFFTQISSVTIAMDILFDNGRYDDVMKLFKYATEKFNFDVKYPSDFVVLYFAACYKLNTAESFESAFKVLRSIQMSSKDNINGQVKLRGLYCFLMLAIRQNRPNIALELIQNLQNTKSIMNIILQSIRLLSLTHINRLNDVAEIIQFQLNKDKSRKNPILFNDVLEEMKSIMYNNNKDTDKHKESINKIEKLFKQLKESNMVETKRTLEDAIMSTIEYQRKRNQFRNDAAQNQRLEKHESFNQ